MIKQIIKQCQHDDNDSVSHTVEEGTEEESRNRTTDRSFY